MPESALMPKMTRFAWATLVALAGAALPLAAQEAARPVSPSLGHDEGLAAFARFYEVASHPRCANCHVDERAIPMWTGPSYGAPRAHGMAVTGGEDRFGAGTLPCSTCHRAENSDLAHGAPGHEVWMLPPAEMAWFGKTDTEICEQLRDPARNGGRDFEALVTHVAEDGLVGWGWEPGPGREPAPGSAAEAAAALRIWGQAGMPCP